MAWTKEQEAAIYTRGSNIIVSAGAGSGKTAVLSERILEYCLQGNDIRRLLVLTFTNAAAREMKERIRRKLLEHKLYEQADYIDAAYITTFDAYSLALVKKYYYRLGLAKHISIMDSAFIEIKRKDIIQGIFTELYENQDDRFFSFLKKYSKQDDKEVARIIEGLCGKLELLLDFEQFKNGYSQTYFSESHLTHIIEEYDGYTKEAVQELVYSLQELLEACRTDIQSEKLYEAIDALLRQLESVSSYEGYYRILSGYTLPRVSPKADLRVKERKEFCGKALKNLRDTVFSKYKTKADMLTELKAVREDILFLLDICDTVFQRLTAYKMSVMLFDYTDIAKYAIELVSKHEDICRELKQYYNEILVDEYQDTSDIQEAFLTAIENHNLYMVGDIKQSIYRFRNANPYIFKGKYDAYSKRNGGEKIDLTHNFRSRSEVLNNINALFNRLMTASCGDADYMHEHQMQYGQRLYSELSQNMDFNIELLQYSDEGYESFSQEEIEAFLAAGQIQSIIRKAPMVLDGNQYRAVRYNDFAVLIDKSKNFITFKRVFEYLNIPLSIEADMDLKDSILPKLLSNILLLIDKTRSHTTDIPYRHALASVARSFLYEYSDEDIYRMLVLGKPYPILEDLQGLAKEEELSYGALFYRICFTTGLYDKLSYIGDVDNSVVVLEYIYQMLSTLQETAMPLSEVCVYLSSVFEGDIKLSYKLPSSGKDSVRIMTIHKSKGLEFPYCIFPLISSGFNKQDIRSAIGFHREYGLYIPFADEGKSDTIVKTLTVRSLMREDISEKVRLLYVAMTRAREKMIFLMKEREYPELNPRYFSCFQQMIAYTGVFEENIRSVCLNEYGITADYKKKRASSEFVFGTKKLSYSPLPLPKKIESVRISKELTELPSLQVKENIRLGLEFHSALEALDFKNIQIEELPVSEFVKTVLFKVFQHPIFKDISTAKTYHEHEFYYKKDSEKYHGIIDLFAVYDNRIDILDYKLSNIDSVEYVRQLSVYKAYIRSIWDKPVNVYLLSLLRAEIKKLDI